LCIGCQRWVDFLTVCCSVLQCVAVCCSVFQCVAVCCSLLQCVAVCCSVLQGAAVCCSVLQCLCGCNNEYTPSHARGLQKHCYCGPQEEGSFPKETKSFRKHTKCYIALQCGTVCDKELHSVAACCSVLRRKIFSERWVMRQRGLFL